MPICALLCLHCRPARASWKGELCFLRYAAPASSLRADPPSCSHWRMMRQCHCCERAADPVYFATGGTARQARFGWVLPTTTWREHFTGRKAGQAFPLRLGEELGTCSHLIRLTAAASFLLCMCHSSQTTCCPAHTSGLEPAGSFPLSPPLPRGPPLDACLFTTGHACPCPFPAYFCSASSLLASQPSPSLLLPTIGRTICAYTGCLQCTPAGFWAGRACACRFGQASLYCWLPALPSAPATCRATAYERRCVAAWRAPGRTFYLRRGYAACSLLRGVSVPADFPAPACLLHAGDAAPGGLPYGGTSRVHYPAVAVAGLPLAGRACACAPKTALFPLPCLVPSAMPAARISVPQRFHGQNCVLMAARDKHHLVSSAKTARREQALSLLRLTYFRDGTRLGRRHAVIIAITATAVCFIVTAGRVGKFYSPTRHALLRTFAALLPGAAPSRWRCAAAFSAPCSLPLFFALLLPCALTTLIHHHALRAPPCAAPLPGTFLPRAPPTPRTLSTYLPESVPLPLFVYTNAVRTSRAGDVLRGSNLHDATLLNAMRRLPAAAALPPLQVPGTLTGCYHDASTRPSTGLLCGLTAFLRIAGTHILPGTSC